LFLRIIKHYDKAKGRVSVYAMNAYVEVYVQLHSYLTLLLDTSKFSSSSSDRFTPNCYKHCRSHLKYYL